jgi:hypothetical protein
MDASALAFAGIFFFPQPQRTSDARRSNDEIPMTSDE